LIFEIIICIVIGIILGTITGLTPGIHINLISIAIFGLSTYILNIISPISLCIIIIAMAITHTFIDFIPSTFLGAPEESTSLSVLPAHNFLLKGEGYLAVKLSTIGSFLGLIISIAIIPVLIYLASTYYDTIKTYIPFLLILSLLFLIFREKQKSKAILITLLAGSLGVLVLNFPNLEEPLFPMLSGLFGTSTLLVSLKDKVQIPFQTFTTKTNIDKIEVAKVMTASTLVCSVAGFIPGIASSQSAILASTFFKKLKQEYFILMVGSINTIIMVLSFGALYTIDKARNGAVIVVSKIIGTLSTKYLILFLIISLIVGGLAFILSLKLGKQFSKYITKINYQNICIIIIILIIMLTIFLSSYMGILVLIAATAIGILPPLLNTGKNHLMACLIIPIILFFIL
jgi:putative membrane protein